jgi:hypothetical protein
MSMPLNTLGRSQLNFFMAALWWPLLALLAFFSFGLWSSEFSRLESSRIEWLYLLWFGVPGYFVFCLWMSRAAKGRTEQQAVRMVWLAPMKFIPFYGVPWVFYGVCRAFSERSEDSYMAFGWIMVVPYVLIAGYFCAGVTVALYRIFF